MKHNTPAQEVKSLETLFFTFFKIGLFTFGGGYAMIALLEEEFIQRRKWLDKDEFKALDKSPFATGVLAAVMLVMVGLSLAGVSVSSILLILLSGAAGVAAWLIGRRKEGK